MLEQLLHTLKKNSVSVKAEGDNLIFEDPIEYLNDSLIDKIKKLKKEILTYLKSNTLMLAEIQNIEEQDHYPSTHKQSGKVLLSSLLSKCRLDKLIEETIAYNVFVMWRFNSIDVTAFSHSLKVLINRNESFRTKFLILKGKVRQKVVVADELGEYFEYIDLSKERSNKKFQKLILNTKNKAFDFFEGPILSVRLVKDTNRLFHVLFSINHITMDFVSMDILKKELKEIYEAIINGKTDELNKKKIHVKDYAVWENKQINGEDAQHHKNFWLNKLNKKWPGFLLKDFYNYDISKEYNGSYRKQLLSDLKSNFKELSSEEINPLFGTIYRANSFSSSIYRFVLDENYKMTLRNFARTQKVSNLSIIAAAIFFLLNYLTNKRRLLIGIEKSIRNNSLMKHDVLGWLTNTIMIPASIDRNITVKKFVRQCQETIWESENHTIYPIEKILHELDYSLDTIGSVYINYFNFGSANQKQISDRNASHHNAGCSYFDLDFFIVESENDIEFRCRYKKDIYQQDWITTFCENYKTIVGSFVLSPNLELGEVADELNQKEISYPM